MNPIDELINNSSSIEKKLGYVFDDKSLLFMAFVHRSFVNEYQRPCEHNERLEFLGDSVLGLLIADYLFSQNPPFPEGKLSNLRSSLVDASSCAKYMRKLNLEQYILLGKGERHSEGRGRDTILADAFEAIIGAIYLDGGILCAKEFLLNSFKNEIEKMLLSPSRNYKADLQDYSQKKYQKPPEYLVVEEIGPEHRKIFRVRVLVNNQELGEGEGVSKKTAQQKAAADAIRKIEKE